MRMATYGRKQLFTNVRKHQKGILPFAISTDNTGETNMSEIEKINARNVAFQDALRKGDADTCASMCAEDAVMMPPSAPPVEGRDAIKQHFAKLGPDATVTADILKTEVFGGLAYQRSRVSWDSNGKTKYTDTLDVLRQHDDGSWLFVASSWNNSEGFDQV